MSVSRRRTRRAQPIVIGALLFGLFLVVPGAAAVPLPPSAPLPEFGVTRPGEVLFERAVRHEVLASMDETTRAWLCGPGEDPWGFHQGITTIEARAGYGGDARPEPFNWTVMLAAAAAFGMGDAEARRALVRNMRRWARGRSMTRVRGTDVASYYSIDRALLPSIVAFALVHDDPEIDAEDLAEIRHWLQSVVLFRGEERPFLPESATVEFNNHRYLRDSVDMAWAALTGDDARFRRGVERYAIALEQMRDDGSFPLEVQRGARALWYQRHAIASLAVIAELAAVQGHDLWSLEVDGRSLHTAIGFLLDGVEDPTIVWPYAEANVSPGPSSNWKVQDRGFMRSRGHGPHYMAWAEIYRARFPESALAERLGRLLHEWDPDHRPMVDEYSGGATSCFFAPPEAVAERPGH